MPNTFTGRLHYPLLTACLVGLLSAVAAAYLIFRVESYRMQQNRAIVANVAGGYADAVERNILGSLTSTNALAALVRQGNGDIADFNKLAAEMLPLYPGVTEFSLAPGGVISKVFPMPGNEKVLGLNIFLDMSKRKEAVLARDSGQLTLAGPLTLIQAGIGLVGRMPVYLNDNDGKPYFWGFVLVVIPVSEMLRAAGLNRLTEQGYAWELWRIHPDLGSRQTIAASASPELLDPVEHSLQVPNSRWTLSIMPVHGWTDIRGRSFGIILGTLFSLLLAYLAKLMVDAKIHASALEELVSRRTAEVRAREANYRTLFESAVDGMVIADAQGHYVDANEAACRMFGYTHEEFVALRIIDNIQLRDPSGMQQFLDSVAAGKMTTAEQRFRRKDGSVFFCEVRATLLPDGRLLGIGRDITERKHALETLRARETQLSIIYDNAYEVIVMIGVEPDGQFRFISVNRRFTEETGIAQEHVVGKLVQDIIPEPALTLVLARYREAIHSRQPAHWEEISEYPSGTKVGEVTIAPVFDAKGHCRQLIGTVHDISKRKQAEDEIHQLHKALQHHATDLERRVAERTAELEVAKVRAEAADRIKSEFLATMSHELRTPLNSIIGFTGIVLQGMAGPLTAEQTKQLGMVRDSARHLLALINDVLDLSKIEAGELSVSSEAFDLPHSIEKVVASVKPLADKKALALIVQIAPEVGVMVSDSRRVEQVLLNLLVNAIKFSDNGAITLHAEVVANFQQNAEAPPTTAVRLSVTDAGIGIKSEDMSLLFTPFHQIDSKLSRKHEGTGLGLAICRRLTILMGGSIEAQSEPGKGSIFTVTLPLQKSPVAEAS